MVSYEVLADTQPVMETKACSECFSPVRCEVVEFLGRRLSFEVLCNDCSAALAAKAAREAARARTERLAEAFDAMCPPLYRESDPLRLAGPFLRESEAWEFSPEGLGFIGAAGTGKTRCAWRLLKRLHFAGRRVYGLTATAYAKACADQFHDNLEVKASAEAVLMRCLRVEVLLLDDMGKQRFTERAEMELFALLEHRTGSLLPTIWTANAEKGDLKKMLSPDRAEPLIRRLVEFSKVVRGGDK